MTAISMVGRRYDMTLLAEELSAIAPEGVVIIDGWLLRDDDQWPHAELPPEAVPIVDAHDPPLALVEVSATRQVNTITRTTDAAPVEVFRFPCDQKRLYRADLLISGVDAGNFVSKIMEGRFTWKRTTGNAVVVGLTVVSDIHDAAAASWAPNYAPVGTDIVFTVQGAAGRTIDWLLVGSVDVYAPTGLAT